jgi:hypothetical protein
MVRKSNPFPKANFALLAIIGVLYFAPRVIEGTQSACSAVSSQVVTMMVAQLPEADMADLIRKVPGDPPKEVAREFVLLRLRHTLAEKIEPKLNLADKPFYYCSVLYWVNFINPLTPLNSG